MQGLERDSLSWASSVRSRKAQEDEYIRRMEAELLVRPAPIVSPRQARLGTWPHRPVQKAEKEERCCLQAKLRAQKKAEAEAQQ